MEDKLVGMEKLVSLIEQDREEIVNQWLKDLESGEYTQSVGMLWRTTKTHPVEPGHCCLGVLADQLTKRYPELVGWAGIDKKLRRRHMLILGKNSGKLTPILWDALGIETPALNQNVLLVKNDNGMRFQSIADYIRGTRYAQTLPGESSKSGDEGMGQVVVAS